MNDTPHIAGVIGDPVLQSLSPQIHNAAYRAQKLNWVYLALHVRPRDLKRLIPTLQLLDISGVNVTTPHKQAVMPLLHKLDRSARMANAVNTIVMRGSNSVGHNTDGQGAVNALSAAKVKLKGSNVTLLGAGGTASAIAAALLSQGVARLTILNRSPARARQLKRHLRKFYASAEKIQIGTFAAASLPEFFRSTTVLIHATSNRDLVKQLPLHDLPRGASVMDCQYARQPTALLRAAKRRGLTIVDGRALLCHQAALSYQLWTGKTAPLAVMCRVFK